MYPPAPNHGAVQRYLITVPEVKFIEADDVPAGMLVHIVPFCPESPPLYEELRHAPQYSDADPGDVCIVTV